ncbi:MAG: Lrp/AsnC family transcriptional regulator [Alphaproteobacteria bacterium]
MTTAVTTDHKRRALDDVDRAILECLAKNARTSNREIAQQLDVAEGTVRGRIKALQDERIIKITAVTNLIDVESPLMAYVGIRADRDKVREVASAVADLDVIRFTATMLGRHDVLAITVVSSPEQLVEVVNEMIMPITGVRHVETTLAVKFLKYDYRWGRIVNGEGK